VGSRGELSHTPRRAHGLQSRVDKPHTDTDHIEFMALQWMPLCAPVLLHSGQQIIFRPTAAMRLKITPAGQAEVQGTSGQVV
jgi:hypothetical protein